MRYHPEQEVRDRVFAIFDMRNISEMSRRTGYAKETLRGWKNRPLSISAVNLIRLEYLTGIRKEERTKK